MPIYVYKAVGEGCEHCRDGVEVLHGFHDEALKECPHCGAEVEKVPASFRAGKSNVLSNSSLKEHGFTKLKRSDEGGYHKEV